MRKAIATLLFFGAISNAAVTSATLWEFRVAGTATSGGGFDSTIGGAGTDMSQFDNKNLGGCSSCQSSTVNISTADAVTNNTTTVTSTTGNFSSALIGNTIYLAGTGTTTGWYQVTAVGSSTSITVDRATGSTGGTGVTMNIGGAISSLLALEIATNGVQAGNIAYVRAGAWNIATSITYNQNGTSTSPITYIGYTTTRNDGGQVTVTRTSGTTITNFNISGDFRRFLNFISDCNSGTTSTGVTLDAGTILSNFKALNCTSSGFNFPATADSVSCFNCWATGMTSTATAAFSVSGSATELDCWGCVASANATHGFLIAGTAASYFTCTRCLSANNTNSGDGFRVTSTVLDFKLINSVGYGNAGSGLIFVGANTADEALVANSAFILNGAYGIRSDTTNYTLSRTLIDYNAFFGNTTANRSNFAAGPHDPTVTGDPFTSSSNFALNATAGAGVALKGAGYPGALQFGGTGSLDIGAIQSAGSAGGGQKSYTWVQ